MKLVFATHNQNKFNEVKALLPSSIELLSLMDIDCNQEIPETADSIEGNAVLKANFVRDRYGFDCFADDTGLEVESIGYEPGVYSARYAGEPANADANMEKLLTKLQNSSNRKARFKTAIALTINGANSLFLGICEGQITRDKKGNRGFGYDPIFMPNGFDKTFAEMTLSEKGELGHRGKAIRQLIDYLSV